MHNLAADPEHAAVVKRLQAQLFSELKQQRDPRMFGRGDVFDKYPYAGPAHNFYERYLSGENIKTSWVNPGDFEKRTVD